MIAPTDPVDPGSPEVRPMTVWAAVAWALGTYFLYLFVAMVHVSFREGAARDVVTMFGCQMVAYLLGLFGILRLHAPLAGIRDLIGLRRTHGAAYAFGVVVGLAILLPVNEIYMVIVSRYPGDVPAEQLIETLRESSTGRLVAMGLVFVVLIPILEEVFYRGALFRPLLKHMGPLGAVAVTGLLFASAHETRAVLPIAIAGFVLGFVRWQSGSIVPSILLHMTFNAVPFYESVEEARGGGPPSIDRVPLEWVALAALVAVALLFGGRWFAQRTAEVRAAQECDLA